MKHVLYIMDSVSDNDGPVTNSCKSRGLMEKIVKKNLIEIAQQLRANMSAISK